MSRPTKDRVICPGYIPVCFRTGADEPLLNIPADELEALRLCDLEELPQGEAAERMNISRGTLQRLLYSAHRKLAFALCFRKSFNVAGESGYGIPDRCIGKKCRFCGLKNYKQHSAGERIMRIAVTCENNQVFQHFGHTPEFAVFDIEDGKIKDMRIESTGESGHGALAGLLSGNNIDLLICGGIGGGAQMALAEAGIELIGGASGNVTDVVNAYLDGTLKVNAAFQCNHHHHGENHKCGEHGCGEHKCH